MMDYHGLGGVALGGANASQEQAVEYNSYGYAGTHAGPGGGANPADKMSMASVGGSTLPEQHEDQLHLGFKMIQNAFSSKVQNLETELRGLRLSCDDQKNQAMTLHKKNSALESRLVEDHQRGQQLADENKELFRTVQSLRKQLERLEGLKKRVMDTLAHDASADYSMDGHEASLAMRDDYLQGSLPLTMGAVYGEKQPGSPIAPSWGGGAVGSVPGAATGTGFGQMPGTSASSRPPSPPPRGAQAHLQQPQQPPQQLGPPQQETHPSGGPREQAVDGKQFFRQARSHLSYEAFNELLASIKRLNNQQQTREETLVESQRIFGPELQDLYLDFEQLLSRQSI